ncbi:hypothetical protein [Sphingomonas spermidinifaciens]|uniref:hypothetical protein n=1 Tax=Sphingomonas spermidinifaciens TaxID=1141889 RepID=UPI00114386FE|nr:hypothetical protein [Sphingomonas spermidinifaciens]
MNLPAPIALMALYGFRLPEIADRRWRIGRARAELPSGFSKTSFPNGNLDPASNAIIVLGERKRNDALRDMLVRPVTVLTLNYQRLCELRGRCHNNAPANSATM